MNFRGLFAALLLVWFAEVLEQTFVGFLPRGGVVIPAICVVVLWNHSAAGLCVGGGLLLLDWIARPTCFPAAPLLLPMLTTLFGTSAHTESHLERRRLRIPPPLLLPLLAVILLAVQSASTESMAVWSNPQNAVQASLSRLRPALLVLLPTSGVLALGLQLSEELGLRQIAAAGWRRS
jgi:hypothetical protein